MTVHIQTVSETWGTAEGVQRRTGPQLRLVSSNLFARNVIEEKARDDYRSHLNGNEGPFSIPQSGLSNFLDGISSAPADDEDEAARLALEAFTQGAFIFFWNESQIEDLDERLVEREENEALFVKLFPLAGG